MRAAQYLRMSTEHQQFSIENQMATINEYAKSHEFEIVYTYSDEARSGIDLSHRPGLSRLLDDITNSKADFRAVLVYDVSRWGRFQDADESACYEFLCRRAGVNVVYCAEPFANDLSVAASLLKTLKRTMAGEYLREPSAKVFAGQCRLVRKGYKAGGVAGYGLRRLLLTTDGRPKAVLGHGEHKCLATERVTYTLGPDHELRTVRTIYSLFLDRGLDSYAIARWLNEKGVPYSGGKWNGQIVDTILTHPRYTGSVVFNRKSSRLRSKSKSNPPEQWIIQPNSFPAIIPQKRFEAVQRKLNDRVHHRSNDRLLKELREFVDKHGRATQLTLAAEPTMATACTYVKRFGSFSRAIALAIMEPDRGFSEIERRVRLKIRLQDEFARTMAANNIHSLRKNGVFRSSSHPPVLLDVARCFVLTNCQLRWEIRYPLTGVEGLRCITLRLNVDNKLPLDYLLIRFLPPGNQRYRFSEERLQTLKASIHKSLDEAVNVLLQEIDSSTDAE
jgi:DNA invertase Pin-like site-specific DNA recombinase